MVRNMLKAEWEENQKYYKQIMEQFDLQEKR